MENARQATRFHDIRGQIDPWLLATSVILGAIGLVMVGSSSLAIGEIEKVGKAGYLVKQAIFLGVGLFAAVAMTKVELKDIERRAHLFLILSFVMLVLVWIPGLGVSVNGARRWIRLGIANFQVVEAVKLFFIIWMASFLKRFSEGLQADWWILARPFMVALALVLLIMTQPDFGSSVLLFTICGGMLVLGGGNVPRLMIPAAGLAIAGVALVIFEPYRMRRVTSFLRPWEDPFGQGYQLVNALMGIGRGEWVGVGLGGSIQKLNYLPEANTDFIAAIIGEELGFIGLTAVIALYAFFTARAFWFGVKCVEMRRHFAGYVAFGIGLWFAFQAFVSMGVNMGILPTKGLTLPLISYGGSSVVVSCAAVGLLLRVTYELDRAKRQVARSREEGPLYATA